MRGFFKVLPLEKEPEYSLESLLVCVKISAVKLMVVAVGIP